PVSRSNRSKIRKERSVVRAAFQSCRDIFTEADKGDLACFLSLMANDFIFPINVVGVQEGDVRLRGADVPRELVEREAFGVFLAGDNRFMLVERDRPLCLKFKSWPHSRRNAGNGKPVHS